ESSRVDRQKSYRGGQLAAREHRHDQLGGPVGRDAGLRVLPLAGLEARRDAVRPAELPADDDRRLVVRAEDRSPTREPARFAALAGGAVDLDGQAPEEVERPRGGPLDERVRVGRRSGEAREPVEEARAALALIEDEEDAAHGAVEREEVADEVAER